MKVSSDKLPRIIGAILIVNLWVSIVNMDNANVLFVNNLVTILATVVVITRFIDEL